MNTRKERNGEIFRAYLVEGATLKAIGARYSITAERVRQIIIREVMRRSIEANGKPLFAGEWLRGRGHL